MTALNLRRSAAVPNLRRSAALALTAAAAITLTGVGTAGADPSSAAPSPSAAPAPAAAPSPAAASDSAAPSADAGPTTPADQLTLGQNDFPGGYFVIPAPAAQIGQEIGDVGALTKAAKVTPEECKNVGALGQVAQQFGAVQLVAAVDKDKQRALTESLVKQSTDVPTVKKIALEKCGTVDMEVNDPKGGVIKATVKTTDASAPSEAGTNAGAVLIEITGTRTKGTDVFPIHQKLLAGFASLRGYSVGVTGTQLGGDPDQGQFNDTFGKSVKKIQDAQ